MKELYLHIGSPKTGSTTTQIFFKKNYNHLLAQEVLYPLNSKCLYQNSHINFGNPYKRAVWADVEQFKPDDIKNALHEEINNTNAQKVILSAEQLFTARPSSIERIKRDFSEFHIHIIVFLRRQDLWLESGYNQSLKRKNSPIGIDEYTQNRMSEINYLDILNNWENVFGIDNISVIPFEKSAMGNSPMDKVSKIVGFKISDDFVPCTPQNISLNRHASRYIEKFPAPSNLVRMFIAAHVLQKYSRLHPDKDKYKYRLPPEKRLEIISSSQQTNQEIAQKFLNRADGILFYDALPRPDEPWAEYKGLPVFEGIKISLVLLNHYTKVFLRFLLDAEKRRSYIKHLKIEKTIK